MLYEERRSRGVINREERTAVTADARMRTREGEETGNRVGRGCEKGMKSAKNLNLKVR